MKLIKNIICIVIILISAFVIYMNRSKVVDYWNFFFNKKREVIILENNGYKRNYNYIAFTNNEDFVPENKQDIINIYYNILNNGWTNFTFYCPEEYEKCLSDINEVSNDETLLSNINDYVNPYNSFKTMDTTSSSLGEITINVIKNYTKEDAEKINLKLEEVINNLNLASKTDKEKITLIHNYIIKNTKYDSALADENESSYSSYKAYGPLIEGYGVCSGYSDSLALFLDVFKIPNIKVSSENHVWNLVNIDNKWLHVDLTWDDNDKSVIPKKNFLLITTKRLKELDTEEHSYDTSFFVEAK